MVQIFSKFSQSRVSHETLHLYLCYQQGMSLNVHVEVHTRDQALFTKINASSAGYVVSYQGLDIRYRPCARALWAHNACEKISHGKISRGHVYNMRLFFPRAISAHNYLPKVRVISGIHMYTRWTCRTCSVPSTPLPVAYIVNCSEY